MVDNNEEYDDSEEATVSRAISNALANSVEDGMVVKWCAQVEVMNSQGGREFWSLESDGIAPWDAIGFLDYALLVEKAAANDARVHAVLAEYLEDEEDE